MNKQKIKKDHAILVEELKRAMIKGIKSNFLEIAKVLYEIKTKKTYISEGENYSFSEYCLKTDAPIPGSTPQGRRIAANKLIKIYEVLCLGYKIPKNIIQSLGYNKCYEIATSISGNIQIKQLKQLISKAEQVSNQDLRKILKRGPGNNLVKKKVITIYYDQGGEVDRTEKEYKL